MSSVTSLAGQIAASSVSVTLSLILAWSPTYAALTILALFPNCKPLLPMIPPLLMQVVYFGVLKVYRIVYPNACSNGYVSSQYGIWSITDFSPL